ncbi:MAG: arginine--tRNA ligase [Verrucomicrobiota bacterium]
MPTFPNKITQRLTDALVKIGIELPDKFSPAVSPTNDPKFGDYQTNVAMVLGKRTKTNPRDLAQHIIDAFDQDDLTNPPEIAGPGFINFRIRTSILQLHLHDLLKDPDRCGVTPAPSPERIVIDFSAPNVAKPMHVGHIRSTIIGDSLARIARFLDHRVITDNHIGDWGKQFGMILYGWKNHLDKSTFENEPIGALVALYKKVNALAKEDETVNAACKDELVKLQAGDPENLAIWKKTVDLSHKGLNTIYTRLDVSFDEWLGESAYNERLPSLTEELIEKLIARESDGAICAFFPDDETLADKAPCIVRKTDGSFGYAATDIATIEHRINEFKADEIWYVVGAPQSLHFDQIFNVARQMGITAELVFIPFGSILGTDRKMLRTREGDPPQLDDLLTEAVTRARAIIEEKNPDLPEEEKDSVAEMIGIGAVKYAELSQHRLTDYVFSWDKMLALQGNTAPYLQYSCVRVNSIFRKLGDTTPDFGNQAILDAPAERTLALKLSRFAEVVPALLKDHSPNHLCNYLYELARDFHAFFENCHVLTSEGHTRATRLLLCELTSRTLTKGLHLLGIQVPNRM